MLDEIKNGLSNPGMLEKLFRDNPKSFESAFEKIYPEIEDTEIAKFWKARLGYDKKASRPDSIALLEIGIVIVLCLITAFLIKIPDLFHYRFDETVYYEKNASIIVFLGLTLYSIWINRLTSIKNVIIVLLAFLIPSLYINLIPTPHSGASISLAHIHLPFLMWFIYGFVFTDFDLRDRNKRIDFIRYNGDLAIIYALIAIAGGLLSAITIGLFDSIGLNIENLYAENIIFTGAAAAPIVAAFIIKNYTNLVNKTAPLIASIFSPLVLITLITFLIAMAVSGKDPYTDRDFLLTFNIMLIEVMGIIFFAISETSGRKNQKFNEIVLLALSIITIVVDLIALSAIFYRLGEYGLTPNRMAVLVPNILILFNLVLIMIDLFRINFRKTEFEKAETTVARFLPVYLIWIIVIFGFPIIFGLK